jgi:transposase
MRRRIERRRQKTRDAALRTRIQIVLLYHQGFGAQVIAGTLGCVPATAVRVANRFLEAGEAGLEDGRRDNGVPKVDPDVEQALSELVASSAQDHGWPRPPWTRALLARSLYRQTGIQVSVSTVGRMLHDLRARWGMARPIVQCPWSRGRKQARLRTIRRQLASLGPGEVAYYEAEGDIHLNPRIGRDWMLPRQQKLVVTPGQNTKRYVAGALAVTGRELVVVDGVRKNSDLFIALLERLRAAHPRAPRIHLVLDNYVIHRSARVQRYVEGLEGRVVLHFLPPYCPDENLIERLWREVHANVTRNHRCRTMDELMRRVWWYLRSEARRRSSGATARCRGTERAVA